MIDSFFFIRFPTSAKDNQNVGKPKRSPHTCTSTRRLSLDEAMEFLVNRILSLSSGSQQQPQEYISLKDPDGEEQEESDKEASSESSKEKKKCCNF